MHYVNHIKQRLRPNYNIACFENTPPVVTGLKLTGVLQQELECKAFDLLMMTTNGRDLYLKIGLVAPKITYSQQKILRTTSVPVTVFFSAGSLPCTINQPYGYAGTSVIGLRATKGAVDELRAA